MKRYNFKNVLQMNELMSLVTNDINYTNMPIKEIINELKQIDDNLIERWLKSNRTDFSIYTDIAYQKAGLYCYYAMTKRSVNETMKYLYNNFSNLKDLTIFDDYNGIGISTIYFILQGLNVSFLNDNDVQVQSFKRLCKGHNVKFPYNDINRANQYDVVLSYEIAEHYRKPQEYLDLIVPMVKPGGLLIISHSMNYPEAPGHFIEYEIDGVQYSNKTAARKFNNKIKECFTQVHRGWNGTPLIYKKDVKSDLYN